MSALCHSSGRADDVGGQGDHRHAGATLSPFNVADRASGLEVHLRHTAVHQNDVALAGSECDDSLAPVLDGLRRDVEARQRGLGDLSIDRAVVGNRDSCAGELGRLSVFAATVSARTGLPASSHSPIS